MASQSLDQIRERTASPHAASFQLMTEDGWLIGPDPSALAAFTAGLPTSLATSVTTTQAQLQRNAHRWCTRFNTSMQARVRGYVALARACHYEYPWPVVAILGICAVVEGERRASVFGLLGDAAARLGSDGLARMSDRSKDMLRRTNRAIFADSVPTVIYALRCHNLTIGGQPELAQALLDAPLPPLMDETSRQLMRGLCAALRLADGPARFDALSQLTLEHFEREQRILSFNLGVRELESAPSRRGGSRRPTLLSRLLNTNSTNAPVIHRGRVRFEAQALPTGFDIKHHRARVDVFGRLYVSSVTGSQADYRVAVTHVEQEFGDGHPFGGSVTGQPRYPHGGAPRCGLELPSASR
ncbi:hypothetical protein [Enhygromyxa salina]|nr:hypothetical protein [Enhygromyxa salina]